MAKVAEAAAALLLPRLRRSGEARSAALSEGPAAAGPNVVMRWSNSNGSLRAMRCDRGFVHRRAPNFRMRRLDAAFPIKNTVHHGTGSRRQKGTRCRATAVQNKRRRL